MFYRRLRYLVRLYWAILLKYRFLILAVILGIVALINLPPVLIRRLSLIRPLQSIGIVGRFNITSLPLTVQNKISLGLTVLDPQNLPSPGLASSWEVSSDGLIYTFHLNPKLKWNDGRSLKSSDFLFKFSDAEVTYPDSLSIQIKLQKFPFSPLPALVSRPFFRKIPILWPIRIPFVGAGSYKISSFQQKGDLLNEIALSPALLQSPLPRLKYIFYANQDAAIVALKLGEVKTLENISDPSDLSAWGKVTATNSPAYDRVVAIVFNNKGKYFSGPSGRNFRLLLNYATDKSIFPYKSVSPISPNSWAFSEKIKPVIYDPDKAGLMLKKQELIPNPLILHTFPAYLKTAEKLKSDWAKIGLNVDITSVTEIPDDFEAIVMALPLQPDPDQYSLWHSKSESQNYSNFNNPRIDKLLEDGRRETALDKRKAIYEDFQKYLLDESPAIFLYYPQIYTVSRD